MNARFRLDLPAGAAVPMELPEAPGGIERPGLAPHRAVRSTVPLELYEPLPVDQVFVPDGYEANYAYPLIVWIQPPQTGRLELHRVMSQVSHRNYIGLAFRVSEDDLSAAETGVNVESMLERTGERLLQTVRRLRRVHHVHSERVYLAGFDRAGTLGIALGLSRPEWFAGMAALGSRPPETPHLLARFNDLRGLRVFLGAGQYDRTVSPSDVARLSRLLQSAGIRVCHRLYEAGHELTRGMLLELDRWMMKEIHEALGV